MPTPDRKPAAWYDGLPPGSVEDPSEVSHDGTSSSIRARRRAIREGRLSVLPCGGVPGTVPESAGDPDPIAPDGFCIRDLLQAIGNFGWTVDEWNRRTDAERYALLVAAEGRRRLAEDGIAP